MFDNDMRSTVTIRRKPNLRLLKEYFANAYKIVFSGIGELHRLIYWEGSPCGGIGVSFIDPIWGVEDIQCPDDCMPLYSQKKFHGHFVADTTASNLFDGKEDVLEIGRNAPSDLGRELARHKDTIFTGFTPNWRCTLNTRNNACDNVLISWTKSHSVWRYDDLDSEGQPYKELIVDEKIPNDYTNRAFNYLYIRNLISKEELIHAIDGYKYFTDICRVERKYGYWSPAYAIALFKSLKRYGLLEVAIKSIYSFAHYVPRDPIVAMDEERAVRKFDGMSFVDNGYDPVEEARRIEAWRERSRHEEYDDREESYYEEPYYVDGVPVYGADDEEDAEILYWNTH